MDSKLGKNKTIKFYYWSNYDIKWRLSPSNNYESKR